MHVRSIEATFPVADGFFLAEYGGMDVYVGWSKTVARDSSPDAFFSDPDCKSIFKHYLKTMANRRNSINGLLYKEDTTIMGVF